MLNCFYIDIRWLLSRENSNQISFLWEKSKGVKDVLEIAWDDNDNDDNGVLLENNNNNGVRESGSPHQGYIVF